MCGVSLSLVPRRPFHFSQGSQGGKQGEMLSSVGDDLPCAGRARHEAAPGKGRLGRRGAEAGPPWLPLVDAYWSVYGDGEGAGWNEASVEESVEAGQSSRGMFSLLMLALRGQSLRHGRLVDAGRAVGALMLEVALQLFDLRQAGKVKL